ncbi:MAG: HDOD domain-containing protein [Deltaproteobacteria bacterium]|nr:HDOD domain-containing protein [Deltaproteobacteria bacterium]
MIDMDIKSLRRKVENINSLPTIPSTLKQISKIIEDPVISLKEIGDFISNDPALTTKILKIVNSAFYGFPGRISSASHATVLLGSNVIKGLLVGASVFELMQNAMLGLWEHSLGCAITSRLMAKRKGLKDYDDIYAAGLLHDIGKIILLLEFPKEYKEAMNEAKLKNITIVETEGDHFIANHADIGSWLAEKWLFPRNLVEIIKYHHNPHLSKNAPIETAIVHLADILLRAKGVGFAGDPFVPAVNSVAFEALKLSETDLKEILEEMENALGITEELSPVTLEKSLF